MKSTASTIYIHKNEHLKICFMYDFWKENYLDWFQGDLRALGHPQRPGQAQPWGEQQVPFIFIKKNIWNKLHERFLKRKQFGWVPRWSEVFRTPSATYKSSTSTINNHKKEHLKLLSWTIFEWRLRWGCPWWSIIRSFGRKYLASIWLSNQCRLCPSTLEGCQKVPHVIWP